MFITPTSNSCLLAINHFGKIGPFGVRRLEKFFNHLYSSFTASAGSLIQAGLSPDLSYDFINWRKNWDERPVLAEMKNNQIHTVSWHDLSYPSWLREIAAAPPLLYFRGELKAYIQHNLAVVGPRYPSSSAARLINHLLPAIHKQGITIVSGLAYGVDSLAHISALDNKSLTWAVLGSGLLNIYPRVNLPLASRIVNTGGALISEFSPSSPPLKMNFPQRNRIISGLSRATLVIEARESSGSLITARYALEQGRDVLAVPGNIFSKCYRGTNRLLADGATVITDSQDILNVFGLLNNLSQRPHPSAS